MTRKDYIRIAEAIEDGYEEAARNSDGSLTFIDLANRREVTRHIAYKMAYTLAAENPRFDMRKFLGAALCHPDFLEGGAA